MAGIRVVLDGGSAQSGGTSDYIDASAPASPAAFVAAIAGGFVTLTVPQPTGAQSANETVAVNVARVKSVIQT